MESRESITTNKKLNKKIFCAIFHRLAYALDLRIYYIKNRVGDKCFTKNIPFINYLPLFIKEKC